MARTNVTRRLCTGYWPLKGTLSSAIGGTAATLTRATSKTYWDNYTNQYRLVGNNIPSYDPNMEGAIVLDKQITNLFLGNTFDEASPTAYLTAEDAGVVIGSSAWSAYEGAAISALITCGAADKRVYQAINLTAEQYSVTALVYAGGSVIDASVCSLYAATDLVSAALTTNYRHLGSGVYELQATFGGSVAAWNVGVYAKANKVFSIHLCQCYSEFPGVVVGYTVARAYNPVITAAIPVVKNLDILTIPSDTINPLMGSISFWFAAKDNGNASANAYLQVGRPVVNFVALYQFAPSQYVMNIFGTSNAVAGHSWTPLTWTFNVLEWFGDNVSWYINNTLTVNGCAAKKDNLFNDTQISVGCSAYPGHHIYCSGNTICNLMTFNRTLSSAEKTALMNLGRGTIDTTQVLVDLGRGSATGRGIATGRSAV